MQDGKSGRMLVGAAVRSAFLLTLLVAGSTALSADERTYA